MDEYAEGDGKEALGIEVKMAVQMEVTAVNMAVVSMDMAVNMRHYGWYAR